METDRETSPSYNLNERDNWDEPQDVETIASSEAVEAAETETMFTAESEVTAETFVSSETINEGSVEGSDETASGSEPLEAAPSNPDTDTASDRRMRANRFASIIFALLQPSRPSNNGIDIQIRPSSV